MLVEQSNLDRIVRHLSRWPNRNTNLPAHREVADWLGSQFEVLGISVEALEYPLTPGPRIFSESATQLIGTIPGSDLAEKRVIVSAHFDTINWKDRQGDPYGIIGNSPGANDDASGVACVLECARLLKDSRPRRTIQFVLFSGEEQGLLGAKWMAQKAKEESWQIEAMLNNDMIANTVDDHGRVENQKVRVLSPEGRSRELARWMHSQMPEHVKLIFRHDRFGRGGDHTPFNQKGFTAVRLTEVREHYDRQHSPQDTAEFVDFGYLARVTDLNVQTLQSIGQAGPLPANVRVDPTQGYGAKVTWDGDGPFTVYCRETTSPIWTDSIPVKGNEFRHDEYHKDDYVFAISSGGIPVEAT